jgi:hypothetical protein
MDFILKSGIEKQNLIKNERKKKFLKKALCYKKASGGDLRLPGKAILVTLVRMLGYFLVCAMPKCHSAFSAGPRAGRVGALRGNSPPSFHMGGFYIPLFRYLLLSEKKEKKLTFI